VFECPLELESLLGIEAVEMADAEVYEAEFELFLEFLAFQERENFQVAGVECELANEDLVALVSEQCLLQLAPVTVGARTVVHVECLGQAA
jgi:hypothetical protein